MCGSKRSNCADKQVILDADEVDSAAVHRGEHIHMKFPEGWCHLNHIFQCQIYIQGPISRLQA